MSRLTTFLNGLRSMRPFIGRRIPRPNSEEGYWTEYDESVWVFLPTVVYRSQPGGHFHFMFLGWLNRKVGTYDLN